MDFAIDFSETFFNNLIALEKVKNKEDKSFLDFCSEIFEKLNGEFEIYAEVELESFSFFDFEGTEDELEDDLELLTRGTIQKFSNIFKRIKGILLNGEELFNGEKSKLFQLVEKSWIDFEQIANDIMDEKLANFFADRFWNNLSDKDKVKFYRYMKSVNSKENN